MQISMLSVAAVLVCGAVQADALAQTCSKHSPAHTVALLELYTSEGCNSCPPADKFVSRLRESGLTSEQVVPLSMHVDYWDSIGWTDVFANPAFTERQRWLSGNAGSHIIYTPELFVGGHELRGGVSGWRDAVPAAVARINERPAHVDISIALGLPSAGELPLQISASVSAGAPQGGKLFVALVQSGLSSAVKAGENRGVTLQHDYVVRQWLEPVALAQRRVALARSVMLPPADAGSLSVVAFLQSDQAEVLQALMQPLCGATSEK